MDEERETLWIKKEDSLLSVAAMLRELGHEVDLEYPHIRVNDAWVSQRSALDTSTVYHFCK